MQGFLFRWFINYVSLLVVVYTVRGIEIANFPTTVVAALVLGIINAFLRPFIILLTLPINILTVGLFTFVINGAMFYLAAKIVKGFYVTNFSAALLGALLYSLVSFLLSLLTSRSKQHFLH